MVTPVCDAAIGPWRCAVRVWSHQGFAELAQAGGLVWTCYAGDLVLDYPDRGGAVAVAVFHTGAAG